MENITACYNNHIINNTSIRTTPSILGIIITSELKKNEYWSYDDWSIQDIRKLCSRRKINKYANKQTEWCIIALRSYDRISN